MPLKSGSSKEVISHNIATEVNSGRPQKQAEAIAFSEARRTSHDKQKVAKKLMEKRHG